jgi:Glutathione S-transferase, N-terminal domain
MRLLYSAGSHFARLVLIALLETGLDARVTEHEVTRVRLYSPESDVLALNPVGRVPTVELDDSTQADPRLYRRPQPGAEAVAAGQTGAVLCARAGPRRACHRGWRVRAGSRG